MKNLFLVAAFMFIANLATAQISYAEQSGSRVLITQVNKKTYSYSLINGQQLLGYGSNVVCVSHGARGEDILMIDPTGKPGRTIDLINGDKFLSCSGSEVITVSPRGRKCAYGLDGKGRYLN
jgi:hypothetical protein